MYYMNVCLPEAMNDEERRMEAARIAFLRPHSHHEIDSVFDALAEAGMDVAILEALRRIWEDQLVYIC